MHTLRPEQMPSTADHALPLPSAIGHLPLAVSAITIFTPRSCTNRRQKPAMHSPIRTAPGAKRFPKYHSDENHRITRRLPTKQKRAGLEHSALTPRRPRAWSTGRASLGGFTGLYPTKLPEEPEREGVHSAGRRSCTRTNEKAPLARRSAARSGVHLLPSKAWTTRTTRPQGENGLHGAVLQRQHRSCPAG